MRYIWGNMKHKAHPLSGEVALIEVLRQRFGPPPAGVILGIGDDCAAIDAGGGEYLLWTVDTLVEGIHFDLSFTSLGQLGWKAMAVNLSDIAAMGGEPRYGLLSLGWPPERDPALALELAEGLAQASGEYHVPIIGGDTVASPGKLALTVSVLGMVPGTQMLRRSGARVGDLIYVTGCLGEAAAGLAVLKEGLEVEPEIKQPVCQAHLTPQPQLAAGRLLAKENLATALIDLSDGVATDLFHVCRASRVAARLPAATVPVSARVKTVAALLARDPLELALSGGEDYQLLFTSPPQQEETLLQAFSRAGLPPPLPLGEIIAGEGVFLATAQGDQDISGAGYDHFRLDRRGE
jgi:thiamine-monophosphate kinase